MAAGASDGAHRRTGRWECSVGTPCACLLPPQAGRTAAGTNAAVGRGLGREAMGRGEWRREQPPARGGARYRTERWERSSRPQRASLPPPPPPQAGARGCRCARHRRQAGS